MDIEACKILGILDVRQMRKDQVVANGYNLNIPRYIDNTDNEHPAVAGYRAHYAAAFSGFADMLKSDLIDHRHEIGAEAEEEKISQEIFRRMKEIPVIYLCYESSFRQTGVCGGV